MISAIDSNLLLDILTRDDPNTAPSKEKLTRSGQLGPLIICEAVYAEIAANFPSESLLAAFLGDTGVTLVRSSGPALYRAGTAWRDYTRRRPGLVCGSCGTSQDVECARCGAAVTTRQRVLADFLIGAHALENADVLLTRDHGYYRTYFPNLALI